MPLVQLAKVVKAYIIQMIAKKVAGDIANTTLFNDPTRKTEAGPT